MEESDSDWDSMSEIDSNRKQLKRHNIGVADEASIDESSRPADTPPHNFRSESGSPPRMPKTSIPGKSRKGTLYDPHHQKSVDSHNELKDQSTNEPLYSKIRKSKPRKLSPIQENSQTSNQKKGQNVIKKSTRFGVDNEAFEDDFTTTESVRLPVAKNGLAENKPENRFVYLENVMDTNVKDQPLVLTSSLHELVTNKNITTCHRTFDRSFATAALPCMFTALILHHLLRIILIGIVKSIFIDSLAVTTEFILKPLSRNVLQPILSEIVTICGLLGDAMVALFKPIVIAISSFRPVTIGKAYHPIERV